MRVQKCVVRVSAEWSVRHAMYYSLEASVSMQMQSLNRKSHAQVSPDVLLEAHYQKVTVFGDVRLQRNV